MGKKVLVTGANSGFGLLTVKSLAANGHQVVGTMRNPEGRPEGKAAIEEAGASVVNLDVTSEESVNQGVQSAIDILGGLDVVVNNAGVGVLGMQEHFTTDDMHKLFNVNVYGVHRVNRAAIPHMRQQGSGLLVHVSSLLGRMSLPFYGPYNASKWALEALSEGYKVELSGFGIDSVLVEPGGFATNFFESLIQPSDTSRAESYGEFMEAPKQMFDSFEGALAQNPEQNPQMVADAISGLVDTPAGKRPTRTVVDKLGMGDHIQGYNDQLDQITHGIYSAFGIEGMLNVKS